MTAGGLDLKPAFNHWAVLPKNVGIEKKGVFSAETDWEGKDCKEFQGT